MSKHIDLIRNVSLPGKAIGTVWDVWIVGLKIDAIVPHDDKSPSHTYSTLDGRGALLAPSLCHPRVRLDAMNFSSEQQALHKSTEPNAKDLLPQWAKDYGLSMTGYRKMHGLCSAGVTHMRALVEVKADDSATRILDAAVEMRNRFEQEGRCIVQICAMFRGPLISSTDGERGRASSERLIQNVASRAGVDAIGSVPALEANTNDREAHIETMVDLAIALDLHLDLELERNLSTNPSVWDVLEVLKTKEWSKRTTRKTVLLSGSNSVFDLSDPEKGRLRDEMADFPSTFVYTQSDELNKTRKVISLIRDQGIRVCFGVEASDDMGPTPESYDPVKSISTDDDASRELGEADAELLYEGVCRRPRQGIGHGKKMIQGLELKVGADANFVLFDHEQTTFTEVLSPHAGFWGRQVLLQGSLVAC
ncbi:hypothetical protein M409DRAFT_28400 [Zasmidium cellare ATCC 36951]|uniref:Amidohydrolase-related domain-containing protein n=1 Tax=Zasmidium cellare ATCC 36951 TaxID=1080233 RepID=A0A6A6C4F9_ZASCE|nr:uncharacterized protein M409DRAFT_28400 [Zasmidium cellare ATCC 36951]KAF2161070.1 hypothetical protein M409DRAFT_28400 [Zasmidium cellare ATCC 36951]